MPSRSARIRDANEPRRRRPATYLALAGAVVLLGAGTMTALALHHARTRQPADPDTRPHAQAHAPALAGDVDGDGTTDLVRLRRHDRLVVSLSSGRTVTQLLQDGPRLEGLVDVDGHGEAIATSSGPHHRDWEVWRLHGSRLLRLSGPGVASLRVERGSSTVWTSGNKLYTGRLDPLQQGVTRVGVVARRWTVSSDRLTGRRAGVWCWDRASASGPTACEPGRSWTYDAGPHGSLPALWPVVARPRPDTTARLRVGSEVWLLRRTSQVHLALHRFVLVARHGGHTVTARVPLDFAPVMFGSAVDLGRGRRGVLLSQEGGDQDSWHVYTWSAGRIVSVPTTGPVDLGGGFTRDGDTVYLSWLTPDGHLYTRLGTAKPGRYRVYAWRSPAAGSGDPTTLHAVALGAVCFDDLLRTYGTCAS